MEAILVCKQDWVCLGKGVKFKDVSWDIPQHQSLPVSLKHMVLLFFSRVTDNKLVR